MTCVLSYTFVKGENTVLSSMRPDSLLHALLGLILHNLKTVVWADRSEHTVPTEGCEIEGMQLGLE